MFNFIKDPSWTFVAVLVAIATLIATLWMGLQSLPRKSLLYEVTSLVNVLDVPKDFRNKLTVLFDSNPVEDLYLVIIRFLNSGNVPIEEVEYRREISIDLGE